MLMIEHYVSRSTIHGLGVFTSLFIPRGALVWQYNPLIDRLIPESALVELPQHVVQLIRSHSEYYAHRGYYILGADGDYYMNHSDEPTLIDNNFTMHAARNLEPGEELTCNYRLVTVAAFNPNANQRESVVVAYRQLNCRSQQRMPITARDGNPG